MGTPILDKFYVNEVKKSETPVQCRAICYQKSSTKVYMIDIDVLINNPERDKKKIIAFPQKIKKTVKKLAKLAPKIRNVAQRTGLIYSNHLKLYSNDRYSNPGYENRKNK